MGDKCMKVHIFHTIYTAFSRRIGMISTKLVYNFIFLFTMSFYYVLGQKKVNTGAFWSKIDEVVKLKLHHSL